VFLDLLGSGGHYIATATGELTKEAGAMAVVNDGSPVRIMVRHNQGVFDDQTTDTVADEEQRA
jgi:adenine deaminase